MGEIIFSFFIGSCLIIMGILLNIKLYKEEKKFCLKESEKE